jgi:prolyl-tRNA editing enzyme YbaK/EbsC (Cys-tRNA(Pro) deacylase)
MERSPLVDTPATRLLAAHGVAFTLLPHSKPVFTVTEAAEQRGVVAEEMVKSILLKESGSQRYAMACILGPQRLDHRAVRQQLPGVWARLTFADEEAIKSVTGYPKGAVNPLGLPDDVPVIFDESIARCRRVNISTGDLLFGLELDANDLIRLAGAQLAPIVDVRDSPAL